MILLSFRIKTVSLRVFVCTLCLVPAILGVYGGPISLEKTLHASQVTPLLEQTDRVGRYIDTGDNGFRKKIVEDDSSVKSLWKYQDEYEFSSGFKPEITIVRKGSSFASPFPAANSNLGAPQEQLDIVRLEHDFNLFSFGSEYAYAGKDVGNLGSYKKKIDLPSKLKEDQQVLKIWGAKSLGPVQFSTFFSEISDNVARDPGRPQMLINQHGLGMDYKLPILPLYLSVNHSSSQSKRAAEPGNGDVESHDIESLDGSLYYYAGNVFDMTVCSTYSAQQDSETPSEEIETSWHEISVSLKPTSKITITPAVSFGEYRYLWSGERTENPSASISMSYSGLFNAVDLSMWSSSTQITGSDAYQDDRTTDTTVEIAWSAEYFSIPKARYSLELTHQKYIDNLYADCSYDAFSSSVSLLFPF